MGVALFRLRDSATATQGRERGQTTTHRSIFFDGSLNCGQEGLVPTTSRLAIWYQGRDRVAVGRFGRPHVEAGRVRAGGQHGTYRGLSQGRCVPPASDPTLPMVDGPA